MRTLVLGDLHGALIALKQVLERCDYNASNDQLIFLGDYVDGWSESAELIQYLIELEAETSIKPIFIRGNHDAWADNWLHYARGDIVWIENGGQSTVDSYIRTGHITSEEHKKFFRRLHNYYVDEYNRGFVHGGFISGKGLGYEVYQSDYYWDRDLWSLAMMQHNRIHKTSSKAMTKKYRRPDYKFEKHKEIYIGHTATVNWDVKPHYPEYNISVQPKNGRIVVPMNRCNVWNLDTGCGWSGRLTVMDIDTKEIWQSDDVQTLYPNEIGRR